MQTTNFKSFNYLENGDVTFSMLDTIKTVKILDSGSYKLRYIHKYPEGAISLQLDSDTEEVKTHYFPDKEKMDELIDIFFDGNVLLKIKDLGFYHKVGVLLHGKEGTGKSTIIKHYYNRMIKEYDAIVFHVMNADPTISHCWEFIKNIRKIQSNPIVIIFEEIDQQIQFNASYLKTVLDGNMSIDNCVFLATTNNLQIIPAAMKDRPSRFKYVFNIEGIQSVNDILIILRKMLDDIVDEDDILSYADQLKGQTLDEIKQFCFDKIMLIKTYKNKKRNKIGFATLTLID